MELPKLNRAPYKKLLAEKKKFWKWPGKATDPVRVNLQADLEKILARLSARIEHEIRDAGVDDAALRSGRLGRRKLTRALASKGMSSDDISKFQTAKKEEEAEWNMYIDPAVIAVCGESHHFDSCYKNGGSYHGSCLTFACSVNSIVFVRPRLEEVGSDGWRARVLFLAVPFKKSQPPVLVNGDAYGHMMRNFAPMRNAIWSQLGHEDVDHESACWCDLDRDVRSLLKHRDRDTESFYLDCISKDELNAFAIPFGTYPARGRPRRILDFKKIDLFPGWDYYGGRVSHCPNCGFAVRGRGAMASGYCQNCGRKCSYCGDVVAESNITSIDGRYYCSACLVKCKMCRKPITPDNAMTIGSGKRKVKEPKTICAECAAKLVVKHYDVGLKMARQHISTIRRHVELGAVRGYILPSLKMVVVAGKTTRTHEFNDRAGVVYSKSRGFAIPNVSPRPNMPLGFVCDKAANLMHRVLGKKRRFLRCSSINFHRSIFGYTTTVNAFDGKDYDRITANPHLDSEFIAVNEWLCKMYGLERHGEPLLQTINLAGSKSKTPHIQIYYFATAGAIVMSRVGTTLSPGSARPLCRAYGLPYYRHSDLMDFDDKRINYLRALTGPRAQFLWHGTDQAPRSISEINRQLKTVNTMLAARQGKRPVATQVAIIY